MILHDRFRRDIIAHAADCHPNEACGVLLADDGHVVRHVRMTNTRPTPHTYELSADEWLRVWREADEDGLVVWAVWHSHPWPGERAVLSRTDIERVSMPLVYGVLAGMDLRFYIVADGVATQLRLPT